MLKLVVMTCMMSAPTSVPTTVARPPVRGVPPTTVAAMASSSMLSPMFGASLAPCRAVYEHKEHLDGHDADAAAADGLERRVAERNQLPAVDDLRDAAP